MSMETDSPMIGKMIDSYEITELIGRGGMGVVYKAKDVKLDRDVALKIMDPLLARDETFLKRFWSEAKALAKLQNPYIVGIYALRETEYGVCIVMEYVKGSTLGDVVKASGPLSVDQAIRLFKQLLMAFEHAHGAGIIHRDVKPGNILVTDNNIAKVTDFGLAKIYQPAAATLTSITGGTLFYASPEQLEGLGKVDQRGDIYSLGMTLYECLTGAVPFGNTESDFTIREKIVKGRIPSPKGMKPQIPAELNAIVMKAIAKNPKDRFQTATEMQEALEDFEVSIKHVHPKPAKAPPGALSPRWLAVPVVLLLIVAAVLLYPSLFPGMATITIGSMPVRARVEINGDSIGVTPISNRSIVPGQTVVRLSKSGFLPKDTSIAVSAGEGYDLIFFLESAGVAQRAETTRVPARIQTPEVQRSTPDQKKPPKTHATPLVSISHPQQTPLRPQQTTTAPQHPPKELPKTGTVYVTVNPSSGTIDPSSARVWVDNVFVRLMPYRVSPGAHKVRVESGDNKWQGRFEAVADESIEIPVDFMKQVNVTVAAVDADSTPVLGAKVFVDGNLMGRTPQPLRLTIGMHTVNLQSEGYQESTLDRCFEEHMVGPNSLRIQLKKSK
jgi:serine/threonine protein kinase